MTVRYWLAGPTRYMLVGPFTKDTILCLQCLAPYTPVRLITEVSQ